VPIIARPFDDQMWYETYATPDPFFAQLRSHNVHVVLPES